MSTQLHRVDAWKYQRFDQSLALLCILAPAVMVIAEAINDNQQTPARGSISAYHAMLPAGAFFIPLTIAVMLFIMNGWLVPGHRVHVIMGFYLLGVLLFDHDDLTVWLHFGFAGYFFLTGSLLEIVRHDSDETWGPGKWFAMSLVLPFWLLFGNIREAWTRRSRVAWVILPFPIVYGFGRLVGGWIEVRWLFLAEWIALTAVVMQYVADAQRHATATDAQVAAA